MDRFDGSRQEMGYKMYDGKQICEIDNVLVQESLRKMRRFLTEGTRNASRPGGNGNYCLVEMEENSEVALR